MSALGFRHARASRGPDLLLTVAAAGAEAPAPARWSATPGRLVGALTEQGILAEATTSQRVALYRFTALPGDTVEVRIGWQGRDGGTASLTPARGRQALTGSLVAADGTELHLALRFDRSFRVRAPAESDPPSRVEGLGPVGEERVLRFAPVDGVVRARLALSTVDVSAARANLEELPGWMFATALASARGAWDDALGRIELAPAGQGGAAAADATALRMAQYEVIAHYGDITDRDGRYRAADGSVRRMPGGLAHIGNLDLAREHGELLPMLDLLFPERLADFAETLLSHQLATGRLPSRTAWGRALADPEPHAPLAALAGMVSRGSRGVDPERVLPPMVKPAQLYDDDLPWNTYLPLGDFPADRATGEVVWPSLQAARAHHAVAVVAAALGDREVAGAYAAQAVLYRQLWDEQAQGFRPRNSRRRWAAPAVSNRSVQAGDLDRARWLPGRFDIDGLLGLLGGRQALADALDDWLAEAGPGNPVAPGPGGDETWGFIPWLYFFSNDPDAGLEAVEQWRVAVSGGAADPAQAAGLLFAALGLYPVLDTAGEYVLGAPALASVRLLRPDSEIRIERASMGGDADAVGITLDGTPLPGRTVAHRRLARGAVLRFGVERAGVRQAARESATGAGP